MRISDWSLDVCSSDLDNVELAALRAVKCRQVQTIPSSSKTCKFTDRHRGVASRPKAINECQKKVIIIVQRTGLLHPRSNQFAPHFVQPIVKVERFIAGRPQPFHQRSEEQKTELQSLMR